MSERLIDANALLRHFTASQSGERYSLHDCDNFPITVNLESVQREIRSAPAIDPFHWIPVSERLPENDDTVEAYNTEFGIFDAYYKDGNMAWFTRGNEIMVTHWRIPEPPVALMTNKTPEEIVRAMREYAKNAQENFEVDSMQDFDSAAHLVESVQSQISAERAKYSELQRYNVDCTKQCDALLVEKIDLKNQLSASQRKEQAAVEDLRASGACLCCKNNGKTKLCQDCGIFASNFEWRGPQETKRGEAE